jgi:hypothetical protein
MTGREHLIQRFLDQELSAGERVEFLTMLARDEAARRRALELAGLALAARRLPRPAVPAGFVERVVSRTVPVRAVPASRWRRLAEPWLAPRMLRWNLGSAAAAATLVLVLLAGALFGRQWSTPPAAPAGPASAASGPEPIVLVRLVVVQPDARTVEVAGDFNGWDPGRTPLQPASGGAWTVTLPLEPGRYEYMFVVNGQDWVADPFAVEQLDDGFGSRNAVIDGRPARGAV